MPDFLSLKYVKYLKSHMYGNSVCFCIYKKMIIIMHFCYVPFISSHTARNTKILALSQSVLKQQVCISYNFIF